MLWQPARPLPPKTKSLSLPASSVTKTASSPMISPISGLEAKTRKLTTLFHPSRHKWTRPFRWQGAYFVWQGAYLVGRTVIGRVTVALLLPRRTPRRLDRGGRLPACLTPHPKCHPTSELPSHLAIMQNL